MKQLQNNFTTPEQSKRLLELGVPADSANCYYCYESDVVDTIPCGHTFTTYCINCTPCWSVGRLFEIYLICKSNYMAGLHFYTADDWDEEMIDSLIDLYGAARLDFSKLED